MKVLAIGDPHFMIKNIPEVEIFVKKLEELIKIENPDYIVMLGDLLHEHERLHTIPLNIAYNFIKMLSSYAYTYCIVGNHDLINNKQYLTDNHWMNAMKDWDNVKIIDKVITENDFVFCPYVPPGRFTDAVESYIKFDTKCVFAHQEFYGCKMGAIVSVDGDKWLDTHPIVISGHIHSNQRPQDNVYYPGSSLQHAFGESEKNIIPIIKFSDSGYDIREVDLELPRKKIVYVDIENIDDYEVKDTKHKLKIKLSGNYEEFKTFKKSVKYKELSKKGVKISYKPKKVEEKMNDIDSSDFLKILHNLVIKEKNSYLLSDYNHIFLNREKNEDVIIL
tara:strand:+ start:5022 stop:6023 length:1002 start_codon:yes stop_codon:yes gene_type:complete